MDWIYKYFTIDGPLIDAAASRKSFMPKNEQDQDVPLSGGRNMEVNLHDQMRSNKPPQSTIPSAQLARKGNEAKLCHVGFVRLKTGMD